MAIEATAGVEYGNMSPGVGAGKRALEFCPIHEDAPQRVLEVGFGHGELLEVLAQKGHYAVGVDLASGGTPYLVERGKLTRFPGAMVPLVMDVSHERLPFMDDFFDYAFCTETIEHLSNPYFCIAEIKRVLKPEGKLVVAFPQPEDNLGYGGGMHSHVYPGFLERASFERFMVQLYFKKQYRTTCGSSVWYIYVNHKTGDEVDVFKVVSGNPDGNEMYSDVRGDIDCSA